jgi:hypothetical protein
VISAALAARAAAGPIDEPADRPASEIERASAPGTEGTGVADGAGLSGVPGAPDPGARSPAGNPLWTIPLTALTATRDRPLFSASRRPPIVAAPVVAPPAQKQEDPAPPPPERPSFTLAGTIVSPAASVAVLQGSNADAIFRLRVGEENDGWRVQGIDLRSIVVEKGAQSVELDLPRPDEAPSESSPPNAPTGPQGQPSHTGQSADARPRPAQNP